MKKEPVEDEDPEEDFAPDGGWGWVVVMSAFMTSFFVDGIIFSFGILLPEILAQFNEGQSQTALVGSALAGTYLIVGPVVSALANRFGCRTVAIGGSFISSIAFICASFAPSITYLTVTYGVIGGLGFGLIYLPSMVMVQVYFRKRRAFATGIAVCGSGIGMFIFSPLTQLLIENYGWRGTLLIQAAISLNCAAFSGLFRPLTLEKKLKMRRKNIKPLLLRIKEARDDLNRCSVVTIDDEDGRERKNSTVPEKSVDSNENYHSQQSGQISKPTASSCKRGNSSADKLKPYNEVDFNKEKTVSCLKFPWRQESLPSRPVLPRVTAADLSRPFYRSDIFFSGSLLRISEYESYSLHTSTSRFSVDETDDTQSNFCQMFKIMLDLSILKSPTFITISVAAFLSFMGFFVPFVYISDFAVTNGTKKEKAAFLLSVIGIANTAGRVFCGWLSDRPQVKALHVNNGALVVAGLVTGLIPFCLSYELQVSLCVVFGLAIACFVSLRSILIVEFLGLAKLTNAFGLMLLFQGTASMIGPPMAGWFHKKSNSYDMSFYVAGAILALSGLICIPLPSISAWEKKMEEKNAKSIADKKQVEESAALC